MRPEGSLTCSERYPDDGRNSGRNV